MEVTDGERYSVEQIVAERSRRFTSSGRRRLTGRNLISFLGIPSLGRRVMLQSFPAPACAQL